MMDQKAITLKAIHNKQTNATNFTELTQTLQIFKSRFRLLLK